MTIAHHRVVCEVGAVPPCQPFAGRRQAGRDVPPLRLPTAWKALSPPLVAAPVF
jgi:hypothetical protein